MKVYISVDMEGVAGVVSPDEITDDKPDYQMARRWMTAEANAAIEGAFEAGATQVVVSDSHGKSNNLLLDELPEDVLVVRGFPRPLVMMDGIDDTFDAALLVGNHSMAGNPKGVLAHTFLTQIFYNLELNDITVGELGMNAAIAGFFGVPIALVTGDDTLNAEAEKIVPWAEKVTTKWGISKSAACNLSPKVSQEKTRAATVKALKNLSNMKPLVLDKPYRMKVDFNLAIQAYLAADIPGVERIDGRTLTYENNDLTEVVKVWRVMANLGLTATSRNSV